MILDLEDERMVVISDLHLGSPVSTAAPLLAEFLAVAADNDWSVCINGDAVDLLQHTLARLVTDVSLLARALQDFTAAGGSLYYVLGNHDLALEHLLGSLPVVVSPLFNLRSGDRRIRIEHGHIHEPVFMRWPSLYEFGGRLGRLFLLAHRDVYRGYERAQRALHDWRRGRGVTYAPHRAAIALFERGFDAVVFGHTHLPEHIDLTGDRVRGEFVNGGDWMDARTFVTIERGVLGLHRWPHDRAVLAASEPRSDAR